MSEARRGYRPRRPLSRESPDPLSRDGVEGALGGGGVGFDGRLGADTVGGGDGAIGRLGATTGGGGVSERLGVATDGGVAGVGLTARGIGVSAGAGAGNGGKAWAVVASWIRGV